MLKLLLSRLEKWTKLSYEKHCIHFVSATMSLSFQCDTFYVANCFGRRCHFYDTHFDRVLLKFESNLGENWPFFEIFMGMQLKLIVDLKTSKSIRFSFASSWAEDIIAIEAALWLHLLLLLLLAPFAKYVKQELFSALKSVQLFNFMFVLIFGWCCKWLTVKL